MNIIFSNEKVFEYTQAFAIEKDHYNGETRQSIEVHIPIAQTSFEEISAIVNNADVMQSFTLVGDTPEPIKNPVYKTVKIEKTLTNTDGTPILDAEGKEIIVTTTEYAKDEEGNLIVDHYDVEEFEAPTNTYEGYVFGDKITVEKGVLIFKKYKASAAEMENAELKAAVDTLLIAMEV